MNDEKNLQIPPPPQNIGMEQAVLGAILVDCNALSCVSSLLDEGCFYSEIHRKIFKKMVEMKEKDIKIDIFTADFFFKTFKEDNYFKNVNIPYYLSECIDCVSSSAMIEHHVKILKQLSIERNVIQSCQKLMNEGVYNNETFENLKNNLEKNLISEEHEKLNKITSLKDAIALTVSEEKDKKANILSYITELDSKTGGFYNGEFIIIAGHTSSGKTSLSVQIFVENICKSVPVGFISLESPVVQLTRRIISNYSGYSVFTIREPSDSHIASEIVIKFQEMSEKPGILYDVIDCNINHIKKIAIDMVKKYGVKFIIIDYIQLIRSKGETQNVRVSETSREIKLLAKKLNIPIIALSQLSRPLKEKRAHRPLLFDLKESGALEQDADKVIFIHRPKYYDINSNDSDLLIVAKNRDGETGAIETNFIQKCMRFN